MGRAGAILVGIVLALSVVHVVVPVSGTTVQASESPSWTVDPVYPPAQTNATTNATVVHEKPENADGSGDREALRRWLADRMSEIIIDCNEQVKRGSSYVCDELDRDYPKWAGRYVEVRGDDGIQREGETDETLNRTRRDLQEFGRQVDRFRELQQDYEAAKAEGNDRLARELAHRINRQARRINDTGTRLSNDYAAFENVTGTDIESATVAVTEIKTNTTSTAAEIREEELTPTELTVNTTTDTATFTSPLVVEGQLSVVDGPPISGREVRFRVGNGTKTTRVDDDGRFFFRYRPTSEAPGRQTLTVAYLPEITSVYGPSRDRITVVIEQTQGTITVSRSPSTVAYNDTLRVTGRVRTAGRGTADVPVVVTVAGTKLGTVRTDETGEYSLAARVPADIQTGESRVVAGLAFSERALVADSATSTVQVNSTPTSLSLRAERARSRIVRVDGQLRANQRPVPGRVVTLLLNGSAVDTVQTGSEGAFRANVSLPESVTSSDTVVVTARYTGPEGNLEPSRTSVRLEPRNVRPSASGTILDFLIRRVFGPPESEQPIDTRSLESGTFLDFLIGRVFGLFGENAGPLLWIGTIVGTAGLVAAGSLFINRLTPVSWLQRLFKLGLSWLRGPEPGDTAPMEGEDASTEEEARETVEDEPTGGDTELLVSARERLSAGDTDEAIIIGYEAVRTRLIDRIDCDWSMTHWELLHAYENGQSDEQIREFRRLTEAYEHAAFSLESSSPETTKAALASAADLLDGATGTDSLAEPESD